MIHLFSLWCFIRVTQSDIINRGGGAFLNRYGGLFSNALKSLYPDREWQPWLFTQVPGSIRSLFNDLIVKDRWILGLTIE
jgi:hypothetical protein